MLDWKLYKLSEIAEVKYGKAHQSLDDGNIPAYGSGGLMRYVNRAIYEEESILIPRKGSLNNILFKKEPFWTVDTMFWTILNKRIVYPKFLYYLLTTFDFANMNVGSAVPSMTIDVLNNLNLFVPSLPEQIEIAEILSSLDDKIDILHRQNKTLEQIAETLFRQWFVEEAEDEWDVGTLGDVISIFDNKRIPVSSMEREKMKIGKLYPYYGAATIMDYINDFIFEGEYILMGEDGTVQTIEGYPILQLPVGKFWVNNHTHIFQAKKPFSNFFIYIFLKKTNISNIITGAVQPKINQQALKSIEFVFPDKHYLDKYLETTNEIWNKIKNNNNQINTLTKLRDTLLPKLMRGEVRVIKI